MGFGGIRELFWRTFCIKKKSKRERGVLSNVLFYVHNIDVFEGGGFACPHDKGQTAASELKLASIASCLTFLDHFGRHFGSQIRSIIVSFFGRLQKGAETAPQKKTGEQLWVRGASPGYHFMAS